MGNSSSRKEPPVIARSRAPVYCVRRIGSRHLLLAGGGGAAATGVTNQIETMVLSMDQRATGPVALKATLAQQIRTDPMATMNMDIVCVGPPEQGRYIFACGQDKYCMVYETRGFIFGSNGEDTLKFDIREVGKLITDDRSNDPYQKCCCLDSSTKGARLVTGGADGHVKVWSVRELQEDRNSQLTRRPLVDIPAHKAEVDGVDVSPDGKYVVSVGDGTAYVWDLSLGKKITQIPLPSTLAQGYKIRCVLFTPLGEKNVILIAAINPIARTSKSVSFLVLYNLSRESGAIRCIGVKDIMRGEAISSMNLSPDGHLCGIGGMEGSVLVLETVDLRVLHSAQRTHGIFVTGIEFLDQAASDISLPKDLSLTGEVPAAAASLRAAVVSLSADQSIQVHNVPWESSLSLSRSIFILSVSSLVIYYLVWSFFSLL